MGNRVQRKDVQDMMDYITQKCKEAADKIIPVQKEKSEMQTRNPWFNQRCTTRWAQSSVAAAPGQSAESGTPEQSAESGTPEPRAVSMAPEQSEVSMAPEQSEVSRTPEQSEVSRTPEQSEVSRTPEQSEVSMAPEQSTVSMAPEQSAVSQAPEQSTVSGAPQQKIYAEYIKTATNSEHNPGTENLESQSSNVGHSVEVHKIEGNIVEQTGDMNKEGNNETDKNTNEKDESNKKAIQETKKNPKYFFTYAKSKSKTSTSTESLITTDGTYTEDNKEISEILRSQYEAMFSTPINNMKVDDPDSFFMNNNQTADNITDINTNS
ncbi:paternally-expressed gene 3 protein-like [Procambarus clarkii]|uniref:paternally-expressed gene 3 protein-like n=1 Tax=Procambarus clarkii TaxID=6728 RepID=UPI003743A19C